MLQGQGLPRWKHPSALSTGTIHHSACLSAGLLLTGAIYLNVIGSKLEGGAVSKGWVWGLLGEFPTGFILEQGAERC